MIAHVLPFLIAISGISANARALPAAQGVTELLSPGAAPNECNLSIPNSFGLSIAPVTVATLKKRQSVTQIPDGQIQAPSNFGSVSAQANAAAQASVAAQAGQQENLTSGSVANSAAASSANTASNTATGSTAGLGSGPITQIVDGQIQAPGPAPEVPPMAEVPSPPPSTPEVPSPPLCTPEVPSPPHYTPEVPSPPQCTPEVPYPPQCTPEVPSPPPSTPEVVTSFEVPPPECPVSQIIDGQVQAPQGCIPRAVSAASTSSSSSNSYSSSQGAAANAQTNQQAMAQANQPSAAQANRQSAAQGTSHGAATQIADGQPQMKRSILQARQNGVPVIVTLGNGVLTDSLGRTGYIADNRQLQFDAPPQAGAVYTAGFSACDDGTLALGGVNTFYACGSSDFNNLYDQAIYEDNCSPVNILLN